MRTLKLTLALVVVLIGAFLFLMNFSARETRFACVGEITEGSQPRQTTLFIRVEEYRWWVGLWSESQGSIWLEIPNTWVQYHPHVRVVGDQLQIYENPTSPRGSFSKLSRSLYIILPTGTFTGSCKPQ